MKTSLAVLREKIKVQAVGLGEDHDMPDSRKEAESMMRSGSVKRLVVEMPESWQPHIDEIAEEIAEMARVPAHFMIQKEVKSSYSKLSLFELYPNPAYPFEKLVAIALSLKVKVICPESDGLIRSSLTNPVISSRNTHIINKFRAVTGARSPTDPEAAGSLFLFGGFHFSGHNAIPLDNPDFCILWANPCKSKKEKDAV